MKLRLHSAHYFAAIVVLAKMWFKLAMRPGSGEQPELQEEENWAPGVTGRRMLWRCRGRDISAWLNEDKFKSIKRHRDSDS